MLYRGLLSVLMVEVGAESEPEEVVLVKETDGIYASPDDSKLWSLNSPITVFVNDVAQTAGYEILPFRRVKFTSPLSDDDEVKVRFYPAILEEVAQGYEWELRFKAETEQVAVFGEEFKSSYAVSLEAECKLKRYVTAKDIDLMKDDKPFYLLLYLNRGASKERFEMLAVLASQSVSKQAGRLIEEEITFKSASPVIYLPS